METALPHNRRSGLFVQSPIDDVVNCFVQWGKEPLVGKIHHVGKSSCTSLADALEQLRPSQFTPNEAILVPLATSWTAYLDNQNLGYMPQSEASVLPKRLRTQTCFVGYHVKSPLDPTCFAAFYHASYLESGVVAERQILLLYDSGWQFDQSGKPLPFEDVDVYRRGSIGERLPLSLLRRYGQALSIPFYNEAEYGHVLHKLTWNTGPPPEEPGLLERILRRIGLMQ